MLSEPSDLEVMRLIAYVRPMESSDGDDDFDDIEDIKKIDPFGPNDEVIPDEYLIDFITVKEALNIGNDGLLDKVASTLINKNILTHPTQAITWRLVREGHQTPNEKQSDDNDYKVTDLRHLH